MHFVCLIIFIDIVLALIELDADHIIHRNPTIVPACPAGLRRHSRLHQDPEYVGRNDGLSHPPTSRCAYLSNHAVQHDSSRTRS